MAFLEQSPDGSHDAVLVQAGQIRHSDLFWYRMELDGRKLGNFVCGGTPVWSADSRLLALDEWLSTDYSHGPETRVRIIDPATMQSAAGPAHPGAFVENMRFDGTTLSYDTDTSPGHLKENFSLDISQLSWQPLAFEAEKPVVESDPVVSPDRIRKLADALPLFERAAQLVADKEPHKGHEKFAADIRAHHEQLERGESVQNPLRHSRLGVLTAYPWRLEKNGLEPELAETLRNFRKTLDLDADGYPKPPKTGLSPSPKPF